MGLSDKICVFLCFGIGILANLAPEFIHDYVANWLCYKLAIVAKKGPWCNSANHKNKMDLSEQIDNNHYQPNIPNRKALGTKLDKLMFKMECSLLAFCHIIFPDWGWYMLLFLFSFSKLDRGRKEYKTLEHLRSSRCLFETCGLCYHL